MLSHSVVSDSKTRWTLPCQDPLSMGLSQQERYSGLPFPTPGNLPDPGIEPKSPALAGGFFTTEPPGKSARYSTPNIDLSVIRETSRGAKDLHGVKSSL